MRPISISSSEDLETGCNTPTSSLWRGTDSEHAETPQLEARNSTSSVSGALWVSLAEVEAGEEVEVKEEKGGNEVCATYDANATVDPDSTSWDDSDQAATRLINSLEIESSEYPSVPNSFTQDNNKSSALSASTKSAAAVSSVERRWQRLKRRGKRAFRRSKSFSKVARSIPLQPAVYEQTKTSEIAKVVTAPWRGRASLWRDGNLDDIDERYTTFAQRSASCKFDNNTRPLINFGMVGDESEIEATVRSRIHSSKSHLADDTE